jgi:cell division initiation protein
MQKKGACAVNVSSSEIRGRSFEKVRKGYDQTEVDAFLSEVADAIDTGTPDPVPVDDTGRRDRMLDEAKDEIGRVRLMAEASAGRTVRDATDEAQRAMIDARREALALMERSRAEADAVVTEARLEQATLEERIIELRQVVRRTEHLLKAMASGALGDVAKAGTMLATVDVEMGEPLQVELDQGGDLGVETSTASDDEADSSSLPDSVDRLLDQLRDIS